MKRGAKRGRNKLERFTDWKYPIGKMKDNNRVKGNANEYSVRIEFSTAYELQEKDAQYFLGECIKGMCSDEPKLLIKCHDA